MSFIKPWNKPTHNEYVDAMIMQLHTGYESDRRHAASELGRLQDERAIPELIYAAMANPSDMLLRQIGQSLEKFEGSLVFPALLENVLSMENPVKTTNSISLLWGMLPDNPAQLRSLHRAMLFLEGLPQKGEGMERRRLREIYDRRLREIYDKWATHLRQKGREKHEEMQKPPKRFRNTPGKFGRHSTAAKMKAAIGGKIR